ncbi:MAG: sulfite exporter TauE/SafE family protein [Bacteroidota bacterium]
MTANTIIILLSIGLFAGFMSGLVGIGGGVVIVPLLVYLLSYNQHLAQGTTLFMFLFPIGILAVFNYYKNGSVDWKTAAIISSTFIIGAYLGSKTALKIDQAMLKKIFGGFLLLLAIKLILGK